MAAGRLLAVALLLVLTISIDVSAVEKSELDSMLNILRANGYDLFSNAIVTPDLIFEVLNGKSFTLFAPTDSALFALDMTEAASDYVATLRCHMIPFRISLADLRRFPSGSHLPTLFNNHRATIHVPRFPLVMAAFGNLITVDRVGIGIPGLFYSRNIAVHGLRGIINCNSRNRSPTDLQALNQPFPLNISSYDDLPHFQSSLDGESPSPLPENLFSDHSFSSPMISQNQLPSPSPSSREILSNTTESPQCEPNASGGYLPKNAPELIPSQESPDYGFRSQVPTPAPTFTSSAEPSVGTEFPGNYELLDQHPVVSPEDLEGIMETVPEELGQSNDKT